MSSRRSLRVVRVAAATTRWIVVAVALSGVLASARFLVAPPRPVLRTVTVTREDPALETTAIAFARAYLALDGQRPDAARARVAALTGPEAAAGFAPDTPPTVRQRVGWAEVAAARRGPDGTRVTVAANTDRGLVHVAVTLRRRPDGALAIVGAPAFVGGPVVVGANADPDERRAEVADAALEEVCRRALDNYLAGAARNLAADLSDAARVSLPDVGLRLERVRGLRWSTDRRRVAAAVEARDADGVRYALRYELGVVRTEDRWEIASIGDPTA